DGQHRSCGEFIHDLGHAKQLEVLHVAPQCFQRLCFMCEIELLPQHQTKISYCSFVDGAAFRAFDHRCDRFDQLQVAQRLRRNFGPDQLDHDCFAVLTQTCTMQLIKQARFERLKLNKQKSIFRCTSDLTLHQFLHVCDRHWSSVVRYGFK